MIGHLVLAAHRLRYVIFDAGLASMSNLQHSNCNVLGIQDLSYDARVSMLDCLEIARFIVGMTTIGCCAP